MKYFSLFTGIGGFELGILRAYEENNRAQSTKRDTHNGRMRIASNKPKRDAVPVCVGYSEIDKYAVEIYQKHFPEHKNYGDITKIDEKKLPDFDLICGGFPCQSFSIAGKRKGFEDTRGTLFFDICRILKAKRPRLLLLENVKGLLSHDEGRTFRTIIASLDELGYDCQWQVLNSKDFGVPQNRERVLIVGHFRGSRRPEVFPFGDTDANDTKSDASRKEVLAGTLTARQFANGGGNYLTVGTLRTHKDGQGFREVKSGLSPTIPARARQDGSGQPVIRVPEAVRGGVQRSARGRQHQSICYGK